ncbi:MAG: phosphate--acyl-ACP acyltransferase [Bacteroidales bacterium]|nr:phosphate--acyl-ACP acyltransferase [Bacteroidales bacterium]
MRLGLDVSGGDYAPQATLNALAMLIPEFSNGECIVLFGDKQTILANIDQQWLGSGKVDIVHSPEVIEMGEQPSKAFQKKTNSSISRGFDYLRRNLIDSFASAGNSGAMMVGSVYAINTIPGVIRPASVVLIPKVGGGNTVLLDVGTNPDAKSDVLYQYGVLGSSYAKFVLGIENPKIGLLNIGEEEKKGNLNVQSAYQLMKESSAFNFVGNIEGRDLFGEKADVVVCDGFAGNIVIKQIEGIYWLMRKRNMLDDYFSRFNYELYGGSPIIGINGTVVIGHGISSPLAIKNMMLLSREIAYARLHEKIREAVSSYGQS